MVNSPAHIRSEFTTSTSTCSDGERIYSARGDMMMVEKCSEMNFVLAARSRMSGFDDDTCGQKNPGMERSNNSDINISFQKFPQSGVRTHKLKHHHHELDKKGLYQQVCRMKEQLHISRKLQNKTRGEKEQLVSYMVDSVLNPTVDCRVVYRSLKQVSLRMYERLVTILGPKSRHIPTCMATLDSHIARFGRICANSGLLVRCFRDWRGRRGRSRWVMSLASNFVNRMRVRELRAVMMSWKARTKQLKYLRKIIARARASELENVRRCFLFAWHTYARSQVVRRKQGAAQTRIINSLIALRAGSQLLAHTFQAWLLHTRHRAHQKHTQHALVRRIYTHWQTLAREHAARRAHKQRAVKELDSRWERERRLERWPNYMSGRRIFQTWHHHTLLRAYAHRTLAYVAGRNTHAFTRMSVFHAWRRVRREERRWRRMWNITLERTIIRPYMVEHRVLRQAWVDWGEHVKEARTLKRTLRELVMSARNEDEYLLQVTLREWARLCLTARRARERLDTVLRSPLLAHRLFIGKGCVPPTIFSDSRSHSSHRLAASVFRAWISLLRRSRYAELLRKRLHVCYACPRPNALTTEAEAEAEAEAGPTSTSTSPRSFFCISPWTARGEKATTNNPSLPLLHFCVSEWKRVTRDRRFTRSRVFSTFCILAGKSDEEKSCYTRAFFSSLRWVFSFWSRYAWRRRLHYSAVCHASIISSHASVVRQKDIFGAWKHTSVEAKCERRVELYRSRMKARLRAELFKDDECRIRRTFYAWAEILKRRRQCVKVLTSTNRAKARGLFYTNKISPHVLFGLRCAAFFSWKHEVRDSRYIHLPSLSRIFLREILRNSFHAWIDILKRRRQCINTLTANTKARYYTNIALLLGLRLSFLTWKHEARLSADMCKDHECTILRHTFLAWIEILKRKRQCIKVLTANTKARYYTNIALVLGLRLAFFTWKHEISTSDDEQHQSKRQQWKWRVEQTLDPLNMPVSDEEKNQSKLQQWKWRVEQTLGPMNVTGETDMSRSESTTDVDNPHTNSCLAHHLSLGEPSMENYAMHTTQKEKLSLDQAMYDADARLSAVTYSPTTRLRWCERRLDAFFHATRHTKRKTT